MGALYFACNWDFLQVTKVGLEGRLSRQNEYLFQKHIGASKAVRTA